MKNRAQAETLNWVFILVAGAIVLGFFVYFVFNLTESSSKKTAVQLSNALEEKMNAFAFLHDQYDMFTLPFKTSFEVQCGSLQVENSPSKQALHHIVFSPSLLGGKEVSLWTKRWKMPFPITNFFYLSDKGHEYILISNQQTKDFVDSLFIPSIFAVEKRIAYTVSELQQRAKTKGLTVVFFKEPSPQDIVLTNDATVLKIEGNKEKGKVTFYNEGGSMEYMGEEMLVGAIIAGKKSSYQCSFEKSLERMRTMTFIYGEKAKRLGQKTETCDSLYAGISSALRQYGNMKGSQEILNTAQILKNENDRLRGEGCAPVF